MGNAFTAPHFQSHELAREWLEQTRWPTGPVCSHCGSLKSYKIKKSGWYRCGEPKCRKDFTVTTGTVMERSKIPLNKWLMAFYLMNASKKGVSSHQLHRALGLDYKSAWFMAHRIREAMRGGGLEPLGGEGAIVEADETYYGRAKEKNNLKKRSTPYTKGGWKDKGAARPIVALVERGGNVRTFHVAHADKVTVSKIVKENVARESRLHTDESRLYTGADAHFAAHETVHHSSGEYVRYEDGAAIHTNSAEGYFSIFKRGMRGIYQHCGEKHLHRYLAEYDHRYNHRVALGYSDIDRTIIAIKGVAGKRLMYRQPDEARG
ncbi:MAG: IS1595 family transposase [Beijerinckiaceae bacterium]